MVSLVYVDSRLKLVSPHEAPEKLQWAGTSVRGARFNATDVNNLVVEKRGELASARRAIEGYGQLSKKAFVKGVDVFANIDGVEVRNHQNFGHLLHMYMKCVLSDYICWHNRRYGVGGTEIYFKAFQFSLKERDGVWRLSLERYPHEDMLSIKEDFERAKQYIGIMGRRSSHREIECAGQIECLCRVLEIVEVTFADIGKIVEDSDIGARYERYRKYVRKKGLVKFPA